MLVVMIKDVVAIQCIVFCVCTHTYPLPCTVQLWRGGHCGVDFGRDCDGTMSCDRHWKPTEAHLWRLMSRQTRLSPNL